MNGNDVIEYMEKNIQKLEENFTGQTEEEWNKHVEDSMIDDLAAEFDMRYDEYRESDCFD